MYAGIHIHKCMYTHGHKHSHGYICIQLYTAHKLAHRCTHIHMHTHVCTHMQIHTHTCTFGCGVSPTVVDALSIAARADAEVRHPCSRAVSPAHLNYWEVISARVGYINMLPSKLVVWLTELLEHNPKRCNSLSLCLSTQQQTRPCPTGCVGQDVAPVALLNIGF